MPKLLLASHSPAATTGYGRVVRALAEGLMRAGHGVVCLGVGGRDGEAMLPYRVVAWPGMDRHALNRAVLEAKPDVLLSIGDPWMFERLPDSAERKRTKWAAYFPLDGYPLPAAWARWVKCVDLPIVSQFARDLVKSSTGVEPALVYHGVDTSVFHPGDRAQAKRLAKVDGKFVVGCVARNQLRKNIPALVKAFATFSNGKDDVVLYLHTQLQGDFDLPELARQQEIGGKLRLTGEVGPDSGVSDELLATLYRAMDVFVLPTMAEGFGLPIMEAQACGTPVLATDFSACPELLPDPWQRLKVKTTLTMARNFEQAIVDEADIVAKLEHAYARRDELAALGVRCGKFAKNFDWSVALTQFAALLER